LREENILYIDLGNRLLTQYTNNNTPMLWFS